MAIGCCTPRAQQGNDSLYVVIISVFGNASNDFQLVPSTHVHGRLSLIDACNSRPARPRHRLVFGWRKWTTASGP